MNLKQKNPQSQSLNLKGKKIHFIGIGGIGMSALARLYYGMGSLISGSDKVSSQLISKLTSEGITNIWAPHTRDKLAKVNPEYIIYSTAIADENEELIWAKENKKNILHRSELLELATNQKKLIAVSGTHGKTTTASIIYEILSKANLNPSCILGGILISKDTNAVHGTGEYFIAEADESDKSFLKGNPEISIITNIEEDHLENFKGGIKEIKSSFIEFAKKGLNNKGLIACFDDKHTREILSNNFDLNSPKILTYGFHNENKHPIFSIEQDKRSQMWKVFFNNNQIGAFKLKTNGKHNALNALASYATGYMLGLDTKTIQQSIEEFGGVKRRFQKLGEFNGAVIIDDYAHHPTEIMATVKAAKEYNPNRLVIIIQPHHPKRLFDLWKQFISTLKEISDTVFITDLYVARGKPIEGVTSKKLVEEISKPNVNYLPGSIEEITDFLKKTIKPKDLVLIMGAGNISNAGQMLAHSYEILASKGGNN